MKRLAPERTVVAFAGDGDFLMTGQEFATAVQYELPIIVVRRRQRHVRHHPHAPGAPLSRPRDRRPACGTRISPPMRAPSAAMARRWRRRRISSRPSRRRSNPASPRSCTSRSTPRRSRRRCRSAPSARRRRPAGEPRSPPIRRIHAVELAQEPGPFGAEGSVRGDARAWRCARDTAGGGRLRVALPAIASTCVSQANCRLNRLLKASGIVVPTASRP